jgi:hypothetical protein
MVECHRRIPVESLEGLLFGETCTSQPALEVDLISPIDLVLEHELEEVFLREFLFSGVGDPVRKSG